MTDHNTHTADPAAEAAPWAADVAPAPTPAAELSGLALAQAVAVEARGFGAFGIHRVTYIDVNGDRRTMPLPRYDLHIVAAWPLAEQFGLTLSPNGKQWDCGVFAWGGLYRGFAWHVTADTAPEAICHAALRIVRERKGGGL